VNGRAQEKRVVTSAAGRFTGKSIRKACPFPTAENHFHTAATATDE